MKGTRDSGQKGVGKIGFSLSGSARAGGANGTAVMTTDVDMSGVAEGVAGALAGAFSGGAAGGNQGKPPQQQQAPVEVKGTWKASVIR